MSDQRDGGIAWTDESWNPFRGCRRVSEGCRHCYAETVAARFSKPGLPYHGLAELKNGSAHWTGEGRFVVEVLDAPLRWKRPRKVFVNSMSDVFFEEFSFEQIAAVYGVMAATVRHTFQVLTKRPERALEWYRWVDKKAKEYGISEAATCVAMAVKVFAEAGDGICFPTALSKGSDAPWPLSNVWLIASTENQETANARVSPLLHCPAAVHGVSAEPLLGPIDFEAVPLPDAYLRWKGATGALQPTTDKDVEPDDYTYWTRLGLKLDWVIVGGESGNGARPCDVAWVRGIIAQCKAANAACFVKQLGANVSNSEDQTGLEFQHTKAGDPNEWPEDLRVRQFPEVRRGQR